MGVDGLALREFTVHVHVYIYMIQCALFPEGACYDALYIYVLTYTVYIYTYT